jgi:alkylhydroperoxidase family enzyme
VFGEDVWQAIQDDYTTAPISEPLRATLGFVRKLTLDPASVGPSDAELVLAAGVGRDALEDAIAVCALFSMIVRLADSLGFDVPPYETFLDRADAMLASGYRLEDG